MISALKSKGIKTLKQRSQFYEPEILALHGMGPGPFSGSKAPWQREGCNLKLMRKRGNKKNNRHG
jgi:hypothetical protein